jgi:hypothetical protein
MELTQDQYERIAPLLPVQRGNVSIPNLQVLNAMGIIYESNQFPCYSLAFARLINSHSSRFLGGVFKIARATFSGVSGICSGIVFLTGRPRGFLGRGI